VSLICTEAAIQCGAPNIGGMPTQFGLSRDWRPGEKWRGYNCEYIKPLGAIGPVADARPRSMGAGDWNINSIANTSWVARYPAFVDSVRCVQFSDGSVYAPGSSTYDAQGQLLASTWCETVLPRFALYIIRSMPPAGQGAPTAVNVVVPTVFDDDGVSKPGLLTLYFPLAGDSSETGKKFSEPFLHHMLLEDVGEDGYYYLYTEGDILSKGPRSSSTRQGSGREGWIVEYEEDATLFDGGHILIRNTENMDQWWHFHDRRIRMASKAIWDAAGFTGYSDAYKWRINAIGAVQTINLTPLLYGAAAASCWPEEPRPLPHEVDANEVEEDAWNDTASWGDLSTDSAGWTVATAQAADGTRRPQTTFTPPASAVGRRPILWLQTEDYAAVFSAAAGARGDTDGDGVLEGLVWTWGKDFKGSRGAASFYRGDTAIYETWVERADCLLAMGWSSEAGASIDKQDITQAYIMPGGLPRDRAGAEYMGAPGLGPVQFGAFDSAVLPDKPLIDVRQAGGMTVEDWAGMIADRLGIPSGKLYVDAAVASIMIPTNAIPSKPHLAAGDGESAVSHIAAVEKAAGIRVCWNKTPSYVMWVDGGAPAYVAGTSTISLQIDYNTLTEQNMAYNIEHSQSAQRSANALKARYGREDQTGGQSEYYQVQPVAHRELHSQGDFWAYYEDPDADRAELVGRYNNERKAGDSRLSWRMPLRVDLLPDLFVQVTDCPYLGITTDAVYQIEEHTADQPAAESRLVARLVYVSDPALVMMSTGGEFGETNANLGMDAAATEGALGEYEGIIGLPAVGTSGAFDDDGVSDDVNDQATLGHLED
jgi:hypothetical protein